MAGFCLPELAGVLFFLSSAPHQLIVTSFWFCSVFWLQRRVWVSKAPILQRGYHTAQLRRSRENQSRSYHPFGSWKSKSGLLCYLVLCCWNWVLFIIHFLIYYLRLSWLVKAQLILKSKYIFFCDNWLLCLPANDEVKGGSHAWKTL